MRFNHRSIQVAVIIGHHAFNVPAFWQLFRSMPAIEFYPQTLTNFSVDYGNMKNRYDVVLFYNYHQKLRGSGVPKWVDAKQHALEQLGEFRQGIVILHHGLVAFPGWAPWSNLCGISDRQFTAHLGQKISVEIARPNHPITEGLSTWEMIDETYAMNSTENECEVLLTTSHPNSMRSIAWARMFKESRVFCYQSGHDNEAYSHPSFRTVLTRGIAWSASRLG